MNKLRIMVLLPLVFLATSCNKAKQPYSDGIVRLAGQEVRVDVAESQATQNLGLGGRMQITNEQGMWFVFSFQDTYSFWMKGMNFPIDIIWIKDGKVVDISPNASAQPGVQDKDLLIYTPTAPIDRVLELKAGWAEKFGLKRGDPVEFMASH